jgi:hypothetical protein
MMIFSWLEVEAVEEVEGVVLRTPWSPRSQENHQDLREARRLKPDQTGYELRLKEAELQLLILSFSHAL